MDFFLKIPRQHTTSLIRLTSRCGYLGTQLSYGNPQLETLQRRMNSSQMAFKRLSFWLRRKRGLSTQYKLAIWQAMVRSSMVYGLLIVGLPRSGLHKVIKTMTLMQRMIVSDHSYRTGHSHDFFLQQHHIEPPQAFLRRLCLHLVRRQELRNVECIEEDILHRVEFHGPRQILDLLEQADLPDRWSPVSFSCPSCDLVFHTAAQLTKHMNSIHATVPRTQHTFRYDLDAATGPPRCVHCDTQFQSWTKLKQHVTFGFCNADLTGFHGDRTHQVLQARFRVIPPDLLLHEAQQNPPWLHWLQSHCIHCGRFHKNARTGRQHAANEHAEVSLSHTYQIYQDWLQQVRTSPCPFCQVCFIDSHQCNTLFQLASWLSAQAMAIASGSATICLHCAQTFSTDAQLNERLRTEHQRYCCIRDSVRGNPQCRHCGSDFKQIWELQRHINRGSCNCIDYLADQQGVLRQEEAMLDSLLWGTWKRFLEGSNNKMLLTITCAMCGQGLRRAADLMRHILTQHGPFHKAAETFTALIEEIQPGCSCNPTVGTGRQRRSHRCLAYRQIAMMHHILNPGPLQVLVPWETSQSEVMKIIAQNPLLMSQAPTLGSMIAQRTFAQIWLDPSICRALSQCCSMCNRTFHTPEMLMDHQYHLHGELIGKIPHLLQYVTTHVKAHGHALPCTLCGTDTITYRLDDSAAWAQVQHKCVAILNLCLLLAQLGPYGGFTRGGAPVRRRQDVTTPGSILKYARTTRPSRGHQETQETEAQGWHEGGNRVPRPSLRAEREPSLPPDGPHPHTRGLDPIDPHPGQLPALLQQREPGHSPDSSPGREGLEGGKCSDEATSSMSDADSHGANDDAIYQFLQQTIGRELPQSESGLLPCVAERDASLLDVGPRSGEVSALDHDVSTESHRLGDKAPGPPERDVPAGEHHSVQLHGQSELSGRNFSMATSSAAAERSAHGFAQILVPSQLMVADSGSAQASESATQPPGPGPARGHHAPACTLNSDMTSSALLRTILNTSLSNDSNWCYLNSSLMSFVWTLLHRRDCDPCQMGKVSSVCHALLQQPRGEAIALATMPELHTLLMHTSETGPRDCAEFTAELLSWCQCDCVDMHWERRVSATNGVICEESGGKHQPLALDGLYELDLTHPTVTDLCQMWTYGHGMRAAFTCSVGIEVCFHRYLGHFQCLDSLSTTELPFFYDQGVDLQWSAFRIQSIACHTGSSISGHFRAILRSTEGWYVCQDHEPPSFFLHPPKWCLERAVLAWLIPITEAHSDSMSQDSPSGFEPEPCALMPMLQVTTGQPTSSVTTEDTQEPPLSPDGAPALSRVLQSVLASVLDDTTARHLS